MITETTDLLPGFRVVIGNNHIFRFNNPEQARKLKADGNEALLGKILCLLPIPPKVCKVNTPLVSAGSGTVDWTFAQKELISQEGSLGKSFEEFEKKKNQEMEEKLKMLEDKYKQEREDADRQMQSSKMEYERKMKELETSFEKPKEAVPSEQEGSGTYSSRELYLIAKSLKKWRNHRFTSIKDELLSTAVLLKVFLLFSCSCHRICFDLLGFL